MALALAVGALALARAPTPRMMGGECGLPRVPPRVLKLLRREYDEVTGKYWQSLVLTFLADDAGASYGGKGSRDGTAEERAWRAVRRRPELLDPTVADRFEFARVRAELAAALSSQAAQPARDPCPHRPATTVRPLAHRQRLSTC